MRERCRWWWGSLVVLAAAGVVVGLVAQPRGMASAAPATGRQPAGQYVGSATCRTCHSEIARGWDETGHGKRLSAADLPEEMRGCEACHGPGSTHVGSTGKKPIGAKLAAERTAEAACGKCHLRDGGDQAAHAGPAVSARQWGRSQHAGQDASCLTCHRIHGGKERSLQQPASELCLKCHGELVASEGGYTHLPVATGQCTLCHRPHGGTGAHDLVENPSAPCLSCHPAADAAFRAAHSGSPVEKGSCVSCHNPHSFDRQKHLLGKLQHQPFAARKCEACHEGSPGQISAALRQPQKELCFSCHPSEKITGVRAGVPAPASKHPPVEQGLCTTCHSPHATDHKGQLRARLDQVCYLCHPKVQAAAQSTHQHRPVSAGNCLMCHTPHHSAQERLLTKDPIALCQGCHATQGRMTHPVGMRGGKAVKDPTTGKMMVCARCHAVHGSRYDHLLPDEEDALCRSCHKM